MKKLSIRFKNEVWSLEYRNGQPYLIWKKDEILVVDRPAYGAEEKLMQSFAYAKMAVHFETPDEFTFIL